MDDLVEPSHGEQAEWPDATFAYVHGLLARIEALQAELAAIARFGKDNPGHGYSCARMAESALERGKYKDRNDG